MQAGDAYEVCESADSESCSASVTDSESISSANHLQYFNVSIYSWFRSGCASKLHLKLRPHLPFFQHFQFQHHPSNLLKNLHKLQTPTLIPSSIKLKNSQSLLNQETQLIYKKNFLKPVRSYDSALNNKDKKKSKSQRKDKQNVNNSK